jgi:hypothetical protein
VIAASITSRSTPCVRIARTSRASSRTSPTTESNRPGSAAKACAASALGGDRS